MNAKPDPSRIKCKSCRFQSNCKLNHADECITYREQEKKQSDVPTTTMNNQDKNSSVSTIMHVNIDIKFSDDTDPEELAKKVNRFKELLK